MKNNQEIGIWEITDGVPVMPCTCVAAHFPDRLLQQARMIVERLETEDTVAEDLGPGGIVHLQHQDPSWVVNDLVPQKSIFISEPDKPAFIAMVPIVPLGERELAPVISDLVRTLSAMIRKCQYPLLADGPDLEKCMKPLVHHAPSMIVISRQCSSPALLHTAKGICYVLGAVIVSEDRTRHHVAKAA